MNVAEYPAQNASIKDFVKVEEAASEGRRVHTDHTLTHAEDCPILASNKKGNAEGILFEAARFGHGGGDIALALDAVGRCDYCLYLFRQYQVSHRSGEYETVERLAAELDERRQYAVAKKSRLLWYTEQIEEALEASSALQQLRYEAGTWSRLFHAFVGLTREAVDVRHPLVLFVSLGENLLPIDWREEDALDFLKSEVEMDIRSLKTALGEIAQLIRHHQDKAVEPLGWFIPKEGGYYMIAWDDLLEPSAHDWGRQILTDEQEETDSTSYSLPKEYADAVERIRAAGRPGAVSV
jgi:hypothetical protein